MFVPYRGYSPNGTKEPTLSIVKEADVDQSKLQTDVTQHNAAVEKIRALLGLPPS
jgi:hypothetical protein